MLIVLIAYGYYIFTHLERERNKKFDVEVFWCISEDWSSIERGYIVPKAYATESDSFYIYKNPSKGSSKGFKWYEKYRITSKMLIEDANGIWKKIINKRKE